MPAETLFPLYPALLCEVGKWSDEVTHDGLGIVSKVKTRFAPLGRLHRMPSLSVALRMSAPLITPTEPLCESQMRAEDMFDLATCVGARVCHHGDQEADRRKRETKRTSQGLVGREQWGWFVSCFFGEAFSGAEKRDGDADWKALRRLLEKPWREEFQGMFGPRLTERHESFTKDVGTLN